MKWGAHSLNWVPGTTGPPAGDGHAPWYGSHGA